MSCSIKCSTNGAEHILKRFKGIYFIATNQRLRNYEALILLLQIIKIDVFIGQL